MKFILALLANVTLFAVPMSSAQDKDIQLQLKQAQDAAKELGLKTPDMQKLMDESAKEDAADEATNGSPSPAASVAASVAPQIKVDLPAGTAKGSITYDGVTSDVKFASAFVDQKDERKPVVLLLTDQKLPVEKWTSEFDMMRDSTKWSGIVAFVDKDGTVYRTDIHTKGRQASVSGVFDVQINDPKGKDLSGAAKTDGSSGDTKVDVTFHAARK